MISLAEGRPTGGGRELGHDGARADARQREVSRLAVVARDRVREVARVRFTLAAKPFRRLRRFRERARSGHADQSTPFS